MTLRGIHGFGTCLLLAGAAACNATLEPANFQTGTPETLVIHAPGGSPGGALAAPPSGLDPDVRGVMPPTGGSRSGVYSGVIEPLDTGGGRCTGSQAVRDFRVSGNTVSWEQFSGQIVGNDLRMRQGNDWVTGAFENGNQFSGRIGSNGPDQPPGCAWRIRLSKSGT